MGVAPSTRTANDVALRVKRQFGDESGVQLTDSDIIRFINDGQLDITRKNKCIKSTLTTVSVAGQAAYDMPGTNIINVEQIYYNGVPLQYRSFEEVNDNIFRANAASITVTSTPELWYEWDNTLYLYPTPDTSDIEIKVFAVTYPSTVTVLTDALTIPDIYYEALIQFVMGQSYEMDDDSPNAQVKTAQMQITLNELASTGVASDQYYKTITVLAEDQW